MLINSERMQELFNLPPVEWEEWAEKHPDEIHYTLQDLTRVIEYATRLEGYLEARMNHVPHDKAVKIQNRLLGRVRKALGFTIHRVDIMF